MRLVFMGTPEFAVPSLKAVIGFPGAEVVGVFTQPDRPKGRGNKLTPSPVKVTALENGIPVFQPERIRKDGVEDLRALALNDLEGAVTSAMERTAAFIREQGKEPYYKTLDALKLRKTPVETEEKI